MPCSEERQGSRHECRDFQPAKIRMVLIFKTNHNENKHPGYFHRWKRSPCVPQGAVMSARTNAIGEAEYPKRKRLTPLRNTLGSAAPAPLHCSQGRKASKHCGSAGTSLHIERQEPNGLGWSRRGNRDSCARRQRSHLAVEMEAAKNPAFDFIISTQSSNGQLYKSRV